VYYKTDDMWYILQVEFCYDSAITH